MINYIAGLKSSIGMKFVVTVISLLTFLILISYGFSAWYMIHSMQEKMREDYEGVLSFTAKQIEKYENDYRQLAIIIAAVKILQKELMIRKYGGTISKKIKKYLFDTQRI